MFYYFFILCRFNKVNQSINQSIYIVKLYLLEPMGAAKIFVREGGWQVGNSGVARVTDAIAVTAAPCKGKQKTLRPPKKMFFLK